MSLRYRKRLKISDGFYINLTKHGFSSISIGRPGSTINIGKRGSSVSFGVPGTGFSYREFVSTKKKSVVECGRRTGSQPA